MIFILIAFGRSFPIILHKMEELKLFDVSFFYSFFLRLIFLSQPPGANKYFRHHYVMCVGLSTQMYTFYCIISIVLFSGSAIIKKSLQLVARFKERHQQEHFSVIVFNRHFSSLRSFFLWCVCMWELL